MKKLFLRSLGCLLMVCLLATAGFANPKEIKVGLIAPLTGASAAPGLHIQRGVQMALDNINAGGGLEGITIKIVVEDDESDPVKTVNAAKKLITRDKVVAIIGSNASTCTMAAMPEAEKARIPLITPTSTSDAITQQGNEFVFRISNTNSGQVTALVDYAVNVKKFNKLAIVYVSDEYGTDAMESAVKRLDENYGVKPIVVEAFQPRDRDFSSQMTKVKSAEADALFFFGMYDPVALGSRYLHQMGYETQILGLGGIADVKFIELGGEAVLGTVFSETYWPEGKSEKDREFIEAFQSKYNTESLPNNWVVMAYDSLMVLADAIKRAESVEPVAIRDALAETRDFPSVAGGTFTFDSHGGANRDMNVVKVIGIDPPAWKVVWPE